MVGCPGGRGPSTKKMLFVLVCVALIVRIIAISMLSDLSVTAKIWEYGSQGLCAWRNSDDLCLSYPNSENYYPSAYMPPLLSYQWLALFHLFGDGTVARATWLCTSVAASLGCVILTYHLSLKLIPSWRISFIAALMVAIYPTFVFVSTTYHQTNWAVFFLLAIASVAVKLAEGSNPLGWGVVGGALCGMSILNRSEMIIIGPVVLAVGALWRHNPRRFLVVGAVGVFVMAAVLAPWWVRNYETFGRFIPVAQSQGYNLWKGYNPYTNGSGNMSEDPEGQGSRVSRKIIADTPRGPDYEGRVQNEFSREFRKDLKDSSIARLLNLVLSKAALLWIFDWTDRDVTSRVGYLFPWVAINLLAMIGCLFAWHFRRSIAAAPAVICCVTALLLTLAYTMTSVHARYRMHIEPVSYTHLTLPTNREV